MMLGSFGRNTGVNILNPKCFPALSTATREHYCEDGGAEGAWCSSGISSDPGHLKEV